jgi:V/A-type H+-transporting ATPase subunit D
MSRLRVPPGRAGRAWLRERLTLAERGLELLQNKLIILDRELAHVQQDRQEARAEWSTRCSEARTWYERAALLGGQRAIALATPGVAADIRVDWSTTAGIRHPSSVKCALPQSDTVSVAGSAAVVEAQRAHAAAILAAAHHAVVEAAFRRLATEMHTTRMRARGLSRRRIPELRDALNRVDLTLEEQERTEVTQLTRFHRARK